MLGDKIREIRKSKKISINTLSKTTGISLGYLSDLENNKSKNPSIEKLTKIANVLNCDVKDFFENETDYFDSTIETLENHESNQLLEFKTAEAAMKFILKQPAIMGFGGLNADNLTDEDIIELANDLLKQFEALSYKYKYKNR
ncbi:MAG: helix-turn-helix transcriptional regulator [Bacillota bacterium]|nr:helix-turn-helix transcriptional regulator [Bacillota bacterium]